MNKTTKIDGAEVLKTKLAGSKISTWFFFIVGQQRKAKKLKSEALAQLCKLAGGTLCCWLVIGIGGKENLSEENKDKELIGSELFSPENSTLKIFAALRDMVKPNDELLKELKLTTEQLGNIVCAFFPHRESMFFKNALFDYLSDISKANYVNLIAAARQLAAALLEAENDYANSLREIRVAHPKQNPMAFIDTFKSPYGQLFDYMGTISRFVFKTLAWVRNHEHKKIKSTPTMLMPTPLSVQRNAALLKLKDMVKDGKIKSTDFKLAARTAIQKQPLENGYTNDDQGWRNLAQWLRNNTEYEII